MNSNQPQGRPFQVIQGSGHSASARLPVAAINAKVHGYATAHANAEAERLRQAILRLTLPGTNLTVSNAVAELAGKAKGRWREDVEVRRASLIGFLEGIGLQYLPEDASGEPPQWALGHPARLVSEHPELLPLHPLAHPFMTVELDLQ